VGNHDDVTIGSMRRFATRLSRAGGHVEAAVFPGRHTWRLWRAEMPRALAFASRHLRGY
jgi:enterochelin esterase-like enzyme